MTDKEKLIALFDSFELCVEIAPVSPSTPAMESLGGFRTFPKEIVSRVGIENGHGYAGFYVDFYFDGDGKFVAHGCWE